MTKEEEKIIDKCISKCIDLVNNYMCVANRFHNQLIKIKDIDERKELKKTIDILFARCDGINIVIDELEKLKVGDMSEN